MKQSWEEYWDTEPNPFNMLAAKWRLNREGNRLFDRKFRLWGFGVARLYFGKGMIIHPKEQSLLIRAESLTDQEDLSPRAWSRQMSALKDESYLLLSDGKAVDTSYYLTSKRGSTHRFGEAVANLGTRYAMAYHGEHPNGSRGTVHKMQEWAKAADLLRCVLGNPFREDEFQDEWRTGTVLDLASAIYEDHGFDKLPVLADALEEAGCNNAEILAHCRGHARHCRGCHVVDKILGKHVSLTSGAKS